MSAALTAAFFLSYGTAIHPSQFAHTLHGVLVDEPRNPESEDPLNSPDVGNRHGVHLP